MIAPPRQHFREQAHWAEYSDHFDPAINPALTAQTFLTSLLSNELPLDAAARCVSDVFDGEALIDFPFFGEFRSQRREVAR